MQEHMRVHRTNIVLDSDLLRRAFRHSKAKTKKALIHEALQELVAVRSRKDLREILGKGRFVTGYDHKALRRARPE